MVIQTTSIFWGDNPEGSVPNIGAKWFLGYNSTLGWSGRKCKMCFLNYMNRAFKWIQKHYDSIMKWLRKFSLNWAASSDDRPCKCKDFIFCVLCTATQISVRLVSVSYMCAFLFAMSQLADQWSCASVLRHLTYFGIATKARLKAS